MTRDTPEPSPLSHEILNAKPYAFLDDAPLEERRTQAVYARRASEPASVSEIGALDPAAIARVRDEARADPRDADELHDAIGTAGFLTVGEADALPAALLSQLQRTKRAARLLGPAELWLTAERLPELAAIHPGLRLGSDLETPPSRTSRTWMRDDAIVEILRNRLSLVGPTTAAGLAASIAIPESDAMAALIALETEGVVLRGRFTGVGKLEWCDRRLLARIHRYTLNRLRAEIEPVTAADFQRFLFVWHGVDPNHHRSGIDGLRTILAVLDGVELPASAWERAVLPARLDRYDKAWLDMLCLTGVAGWARLGVQNTRTATPHATLRVALLLREHADAWHALRFNDPPEISKLEEGLTGTARQVLQILRARGASFLGELQKACAVDEASLLRAIADLAGDGLIVSDGFAGVRSVMRTLRRQPQLRDRHQDLAGRWSGVRFELSARDRELAIETQARTLLGRYGVVFRRLLERETNAAPWRALTAVYRRLEARGEIRGGRFVSGMSGEQFALPEAVERMRETRKAMRDGRLMTISAVDPLNLTGVLTSGIRVRSLTSNRLVYRDGVALAVMEGDYIRPLAPIDSAAADGLATALAGRPRPAVTSGFVGR